jgi:hypothetical protein
VGDLLGTVFFGLLVVVPLWRIFQRAGFHPAWALAVFAPFVGGLIPFLVLAFAPWPALERRAGAFEARDPEDHRP